MKRNRKELDAILDQVVAGVRDERVEDATMNDAASRVWARVSEQASGEKSVDSPASVSATERIGG